MGLHMSPQADYQVRLNLAMPIHRRGHLAQFSIDQLTALAVIRQ
jgi:hypothetical protein